MSGRWEHLVQAEYYDLEHLVQAEYYDLEHLVPGDHVTYQGRLYEVTRAPLGGVLTGRLAAERGTGVPVDGRPRRVIALARLGTVQLLAPGPGRLAGLRGPFWEMTSNPVDALQLLKNERFARGPYAGAQMALTIGGELTLRHRDGFFSLAVPGDDILFGHRRSVRPRLRVWGNLEHTLQVAGRLDGGLSAAGQLVHHDARLGFGSPGRVWTRAVQAHLGLDPHVAAETAAHRLVAELAPGWTLPLGQLAAVLSALDLHPAS